MKLPLILLFLVAFINEIHGQSDSRPFDEKWHMDLAWVPSLGIQKSPATVKGDYSEYLLAGGNRGIGALSAYNAYKLSFYRHMNKRMSIGLGVRRQVLVENIGTSTLSEQGVLLPLVNHSVEMKINVFTSLVPVKKHLFIFVGSSRLKIHEKAKKEFILPAKYEKGKLISRPYLGVGIGGNEFFTKKLYFHYNCDVKLHLAALALNNPIESFYSHQLEDDVKLSEIPNLSRSNYFNFGIGVGLIL